MRQFFGMNPSGNLKDAVLRAGQSAVYYADVKQRADSRCMCGSLRRCIPCAEYWMYWNEL